MSLSMILRTLTTKTLNLNRFLIFKDYVYYKYVKPGNILRIE